MAEEVQKKVEEIEEFIADGELEKAEEAIDAAIEALGPKDELLILRAETALEKEEYRECLVAAEEGAKQTEDEHARGVLLTHAGYARFYLNELQDARKTFNEAVRLSEGSWSALIGRAMVHEELRFLRAALLDLERAMELDPEEGQPYGIRGSIQMLYGNLKEAREDFEKALSLDPEDEESRLSLARLLAVDQKTAEAIEALEPLVEDGEDPEFVMPAALLRSQLSLTLGSTEAAAEDANLAIELEPEQPWGYLQLAASHLMAGNAGDALEALKEAEEKVGDLRDAPDILALRASAYDQLEKPEKAAEARAAAEGTARLPSIVYGDVLNPAKNVPLNPAKPIDVRALMNQLFGDASKAPKGYEEAVRNVIDKIPELVQQNPGVGQLRIQLPPVAGMGTPPSLVIQVNPNAPKAQNA